MKGDGFPAADAPDASGVAEDELVRVLDDYLAEMDAGRPPDPEGLIAAHPRIADRLRDCLSIFGLAEDLGGDPGGTRPTDDGVRGVPARLGDFRLIRQIGRGGMGIVYEAEQLSLRRRVALKLMPLAATFDPRQLQRFQVEAHAAACLHHTNIVPVHAVGTERGVPYYAMQLIDGRSLADMIGDLRRFEGIEAADGGAPGLAGISTSTLAAELLTGMPANPGSDTPTTDLPAHPVPDLVTGVGRAESTGPAPTPAGDVPRRRSSTSTRDYIRNVARLGNQAAEALDHAHTRGILHRDIKPANLLVDTGGRLWVTDFGLAQIQGNPGLTSTGDLLGTLRYMSPEQALARRVVIDGRTDVYSLGATIYELLTLRPAFDGRDRQEILRRIAEEEPVPPRRLNPAVPRDLETIVARAMAKEPDERYATAQELADDLQRFLRDVPTRARRASILDRMRKWCRRHQALVAAAVILFAVASCVLGVGIVLIAREQQEAVRQRDEALARRRQARQAVETMFSEVAEQWLEDEPQLTDVQERFLKEALRFYTGFAGEPATDPELRNEMASAYGRMGQLRGKLGQLAEAEEAYRRAIELFERLVNDSPQVLVPRLNLAQTLNHLGNLLEGAGGLKEAENAYRQAIDLLAVHEPAARRELAMTLDNLGRTLARGGKPDDAESIYRRSLEIREQLFAESPDDLENRSGLGAVLNNLANLLSVRGQPEMARRLLEQAIEHQEAAIQQNPRRHTYRLFLRNHNRVLGQTLVRLGEPGKAERAYRRSLAEQERLARDFPTIPRYQELLGNDHASLAIHLARTEQLAEAVVHFRKAVDIHDELATKNRDEPRYRHLSASDHLNLGVALRDAGRHREAADHGRRAMELRDSINGSDWFFMAIVDWDLGDHDRARQWYTKAVAWMDKNPSGDEMVNRLRTEAKERLESKRPPVIGEVPNRPCDD